MQQQGTMHRHVRFYIGFLALFATGCDPGYSYRAIRSDGTLVPLLTTELHAVSITLGGFDILTGCANLHQYLQISNDSEVEAILLGATLTTQDKSICGRLPGEGEAHWRTVAPGETKDIGVLFDLWSSGGVAEDVLSPSVSITWELQIGDKVEEIDVQLERVLQ